MITDEDILNKYTKEQLLEALHSLAYNYIFNTTNLSARCLGE